MARPVSPEKGKMLLEDKIGPLVLKMAIPTIIAQLITTIYNLVDTYFVSTIGTSATAAVGVNSSLERTITVVGSLIGGGACSYIARLLGADRKKGSRPGALHQRDHGFWHRYRFCCAVLHLSGTPGASAWRE